MRRLVLLEETKAIKMFGWWEVSLSSLSFLFLQSSISSQDGGHVESRKSRAD